MKNLIFLIALTAYGQTSHETVIRGPFDGSGASLFRVRVVTSDPGSCVNGELIFNSTAGSVKTCVSGAWVAVGTGGVYSRTPSTVSSFPYSVVSGDRNALKVLSSGSPGTVNLLAAATAGSGFTVHFLNISSGTITIAGQAGENINGVTGGTISLLMGYGAYAVSDGAGWRVVSLTVQGGSGINAVLDPTTGRLTISATEDRRVLSMVNAGTTGTTLNRLVKSDSSGNAIIAATTDTGGIFGVAIENAGTAGTVTVLAQGEVLLGSEGNTTAGHFIGISATTAGTGTSSSTCPSGQVLGIWRQTGTGAANRVAYISPGTCAAAGGGSSWGTFSLVQPAASATTCTTSLTALGSVSITGIGSTGTIEFEAMVQKVTGTTDTFELQALFDGNDVGDINGSGAPVTHGASDAIGLLRGSLNLTGAGTVVSRVQTTREGGSPNVHRYRLRTLTPGATSTLQILARCSGTTDTMRLVYLNARRIP